MTDRLRAGRYFLGLDPFDPGSPLSDATCVSSNHLLLRIMVWPTLALSDPGFRAGVSLTHIHHFNEQFFYRPLERGVDRR